MRFRTKSDYDAYMTEYRVKMRDPDPGRGQADDDLPDSGPESTLQKKIVDVCEREGYPCLCFPQSEKLAPFLPPGWPD